MAYNPTWSNGDANGRLIGGQYTVRLSDANELAAAINRRRLLTFQGVQDFSSHLYAGAPVREATLDSALYPPFDHLRGAITTAVLYPPIGSLGGVPPTPAAMEWLWPVSDGDENKRLVSGYNPPGPNGVGLLPKINGTNQWTDANLQPAATAIRAVHFNELRQAVEWVRHGRWDLPIYWMSGLFDLVPDAPWTAERVFNSGYAELRNAGYAVFRDDQSPLRGLINVTVRPSSYLEVTADYHCQVKVYQSNCVIDWYNNLPSWNSPWGAPGGIDGNATLLGSVSLAAGVPGQITGANVATGLQNIIDGGEQNFLICREDTSYYVATVSAHVVIEFDLNTPPN